MDRLAEMKHFAEDVGLFFEQMSLPRMAGRVLGWLLICDPSHQSMNELAEALSASKASISNNTRLLIQFGLIERISLPGERRDYFRIEPNAWQRMIKHRAAQVVSFRRLAERGLTLIADKEPHLKTRLQEMRDIYAFYEREFPRLIEKFDREQAAKNNG